MKECYELNPICGCAKMAFATVHFNTLFGAGGTNGRSLYAADLIPIRVYSRSRNRLCTWKSELEIFFNHLGTGYRFGRDRFKAIRFIQLAFGGGREAHVKSVKPIKSY